MKLLRSERECKLWIIVVDAPCWTNAPLRILLAIVQKCLTTLKYTDLLVFLLLDTFQFKTHSFFLLKIHLRNNARGLRISIYAKLFSICHKALQYHICKALQHLYKALAHAAHRSLIFHHNAELCIEI